MRRTLFAILLACPMSMALPVTSHAQQQVVVSTPFNTVTDSFWERTGIGWGLSGRGWSFHNGGPGPAPKFGGYDANSDAHFGFGGRSGDLSWTFNMLAGQGHSRSVVSQVPSVTVMNGQTGQVFDGRIRPFVTGFIPVVGHGGSPGPVIVPWQQRLQQLNQQQIPLRPKYDDYDYEYEKEVERAKPAPPVEDDPPLKL